MKITYIGHSGFLVETQRENYLFDYYKGAIPAMEQDKPLFVFASHKHQDHFNPDIFKLAKQYPDITFVLSYDIKVKPFTLEKWQVDEKTAEHIKTVRANETYTFGGFLLRTFKSTDAGVAFLLETSEGTLYHAGDLNWWYWEGEEKSFNNNMTAAFKRETEKMTGMSIDVAFVPLDPRQENAYYLGMDYLMSRVDIKYIFPMHFWGDFSVIDRFMAEGHGKGSRAEIVRLRKEGESFTIFP